MDGWLIWWEIEDGGFYYVWDFGLFGLLGCLDLLRLAW